MLLLHLPKSPITPCLSPRSTPELHHFIGLLLNSSGTSPTPPHPYDYVLEYICSYPIPVPVEPGKCPKWFWQGLLYTLDPDTYIRDYIVVISWGGIIYQQASRRALLKDRQTDRQTRDVWRDKSRILLFSIYNVFFVEKIRSYASPRPR